MKSSQYMSLLIASVMTSSAVATPLATQTRVPTPTAVMRNPAQDIESRKIQIASQLAENLFFLEQQQAVLKARLENFENFKPSHESNYPLATALVVAAASYASYKFAKKTTGVPAMAAWLGALSGAALSIYSASLGVLARIDESMSDKAEKEKMLAAIKEAEGIISSLKNETQIKLQTLAGTDPLLIEKLKRNIASEHYRLERIAKLSAELTQTKYALEDAQDSATNSKYYATYSTLQLIAHTYKTYVQSRGGKVSMSSKIWLAVDTIFVTGVAYLAYEKHQTVEEKKRDIATIETSLVQMEKDYKAAIIDSLTQK